MVFAAVGVSDAATPPRAGSRLDWEENRCALCHSEEDLWEDDNARLFVPKDQLARDVHALAGVNCHDCHGGDPSTLDVPQAHSVEVEEKEETIAPFRSSLSEVYEACGECHRAEQRGLLQGAHAQANLKKTSDQETLSTCADCHGTAHGMVSVEDPASPAFAHHQVALCGKCHSVEMEGYQDSVHGWSLEKAGLVVTAVCADCHGAHEIYPASDQRSMLHPAHVSATCGACHRFIGERLAKSVHGGEKGPGRETTKAARGGQVQRNPTCTDCHKAHEGVSPTSEAYRRQLAHECGECHSDLLRAYPKTSFWSCKKSEPSRKILAAKDFDFP
ncbi:MAG: hypothetical protein GXP27_22305, partial [Planctomycetes bacterium]|nr:hypothetical protein [Planctomycetota bacterium]